MTDSKAEIRKLVEDWAAAVRRRDLPAILAHHAPDMLMFDVPPPFLSRGRDAYRLTWDEFFRWAPDPVVFDIRDMEITAGEDVAFVAAQMRCAGGIDRAAAEPLDFRLTIGVVRRDGQWIILHEHHSVPAED